MKIIEKIKKLFKIKSTEEKLLEFIARINYSDIVKMVCDKEVKYAITNHTIGVDEQAIITGIHREAYHLVKSAIIKYHDVNIKEARKFRDLLTEDMVINYVDENILVDNDYIVESFQRFIDANLERVEKEDKERELELQDQYEDLDFISNEDREKASKFDNPYFKVYGEDENEVINPPTDEESDIVSEDDGSIEIIGEIPYEEE